MRILGIDPGYGRVGWGVIDVERRASTFVACGCITTPAKTQLPDRLFTIQEEIKKVLALYKPHHSAVEKLFFFKNAKTAMDVGQARGAILLTLNDGGVPLFECTPLQVKQTITGYGRAEKSQIGKMVKMILKLKTVPTPDDVADALAIALTAAAQLK